MKLKLHIWRQSAPDVRGGFETIAADNVSAHMSFLEMLDVVNEGLIAEGKEPVAFDHDCREGICGTCGMMINGNPHGPWEGTSACQLHMRAFQDGDEIWIEPWRARAFPVLKDLVVDRSAFDRIIQAGGYVSIRTGSAPDANAVPIGKEWADEAFDAAACIGCGACVAACPNASAMLFTAAKVTQLARLPQGQPERYERVLSMVDTHDSEGFGNCTNHGACQNACPKGISVDYIAQLNRDLFKATLMDRPDEAAV
ncbi:MAG: succinate dehydrogenase/fumarate reductase iron-sulfur subunit [Gemmatimonadales bacterium]|jgi:succinate dehydrogenase / fumarate reductase iron-sulfur subunit|nr:MAG: succinate dehydrogenase/fumarate reductase iron-sulfur subunit [Gemmatimonadales bacterium]